MSHSHRILQVRQYVIQAHESLQQRELEMLNKAREEEEQTQRERAALQLQQQQELEKLHLEELQKAKVAEQRITLPYLSAGSLLTHLPLAAQEIEVHGTEGSGMLAYLRHSKQLPLGTCSKKIRTAFIFLEGEANGAPEHLMQVVVVHEALQLEFGHTYHEHVLLIAPHFAAEGQEQYLRVSSLLSWPSPPHRGTSCNDTSETSSSHCGRGDVLADDMVDAQQEQGSIQDGEALGWTKGGMSNPTACGGRLSSFEALDSLLSVLCDQKIYPNMKNVLLHGNGVAGIACALYAACNSYDDSSRDLRQEKPKATIRYFPASVDSFLYLTAQRPTHHTAPEDFNDEEWWQGDYQQSRLSNFKVPASNPLLPGYNNYPYGLEGIENTNNGYLIKAHHGGSTVVDRLLFRDVTYLVAASDIQNQTYRNSGPDCSLNKSQAAAMQGSSRVQRLLLYHQHLQEVYQGGIARPYVHKVVVLPNTKRARLIQARAARQVAFSQCFHPLLTSQESRKELEKSLAVEAYVLPGNKTGMNLPKRK